MSILELADRLGVALSVHTVAGSNLTRNNRMDRALVTEDIVVPVLKELYKWQALQNPNVQNAWTKGFDLIDEDAKIAVQVTLDSRLNRKVRDSLAAFVASRPDAEYRELYFLILQMRPVNTKSLENIAVPDGIDFSPSKHVIEINDLIAKAGAVENYDNLKRVVEELEKVIGLSRDDRYSVDAIALSNDLVVTLGRGFEPGPGEGFHRQAWRHAATLLDTYQRAGSVARLGGEARVASGKFVDVAKLAIDKVRIFTEGGCNNVKDFTDAAKAWGGVRDAQWELAAFDEQTSEPIAEELAQPRGLLALLRRWFKSR